MENNQILYLTLKEGKLIFSCLAELPFKVVFELIGKINQQTINQKVNNELDEIKLELTKKEIEIIIVFSCHTA